MNTVPKWRTGTLKQLLLLAFVLVVLPLSLLLVEATSALEAQSSAGMTAARQSLSLSQHNQQLRVLAEDILRSTRQYEIVSSPELLERLNIQLSDLDNQLDVHSFLLERQSAIQPIKELISQLLIQPPSAEQSLKLQHATDYLIRQAVSQQQEQLSELNDRAAEVKQHLWWQASLVIILSAVMIWLFSNRISHPVAQLIRHIQAIGHGERQLNTRLSGPRELTALNDQLEWLSERLFQLEQEKQTFLRHISHELKTPLTTLREGADLLEEQIAGPLNANQQEVVQLIQQNSFELQSLIEKLLDYNRLQQSIRLRPVAINLYQAFREAVHPHRWLIEQKHILLSLDDGELTWHGDSDMLQRILSNLISNAVYYGDENGELTLTCQQTENSLHLDVTNTGPVISANDEAKIFEPFYQGDNRRHGPIKGSGIGLSVALEAASRLKGSLYLQDNQNNRVTFRLSLPLNNTDDHAS